MGVLDALIGGAGGVIQSGLNLVGTALTNRSNEGLMRESWARDDTAVQRRAKDMEDAGFNPLLAVGSPAGNSGPVRMEAPEFGNPVDDAYRAAKTAQDISMTQSNKDLVDAKAREANATATLAEAETRGKMFGGVWEDRAYYQALDDMTKARQDSGIRLNLSQTTWMADKVRELVSAAKSSADEAEFQASKQAVLNDIKFRLAELDMSNAEIANFLNELNKRWSKFDKWAGFAGQVLGGAARAGMTYAGISSGMLNQAKRLTPSEY